MPLVPAYIAQLEPYKAGKPIEEAQRELGLEWVIKLASNENPLGPSPLAMAAIHSFASGVHRYPDPGGFRLREALAKRLGVGAENLILGSGSESLIGHIVRTFLHGEEEALTSDGSFVSFSLQARAHGAQVRTVPLKQYGYDLEAIAGAIGDKTKLIYLANPNNPTGTMFHRAEFEAFLAQVPEDVLVLLDEAYLEFCQHIPTYPDSLHYRRPNLIALRTFSKAYGMASLRLGYGIADAALITELHKVRFTFEPCGVALAAGLAALEDDTFLEQTQTNNAQGLAQLASGFERLGVRYIPTFANFLLTEWERPELAMAIYEALLRRGLIVRPTTQFGLASCLRISIGLPEENEALLEALAPVFAELRP